ncbi:metal homeostatis protein bsd2 [Coprinopsis cinerea okayama7|uniref:Metal homeostatis protein bsd2 n=1 Tax=Coprinopsis cinerea (strain Okayama-7 / 130 / ATCC MYA-4618 / FGSC 9003) TaxID=240176 RepID=A8NTX9_COPC7|nr:metal homeostatis protein bsd2 [Coprinopsis cinerea okayama7\|eukprot:XP_001836329.2 metal homeostatis protein bsd2 [Coprinopsis cinerea okayama7\
MPARYAPLPNPSSNVHDPERELEDAFELNDEDDHDHSVQHHGAAVANANLPPQPQGHPAHARHPSLPPAYDFERQDYDFPPPGSPPRPTDRALPNNYGNSNGLLPESPVIPQPRQPSLWSRAVGAVFPSRYQRVASSESSQRRIGGGTENDGVFANVMAKPQAARTERAEDGSIFVVPEESQKETPPSYAEAQADAVPPYWETTVHAPASNDPNADMIIDDLPTGSFLVFAINLIFSFFFQFVGFFLTYLLHTTHAAKFGSRAGLGLTLIQYGFYSRMVTEEEAGTSHDIPTYKNGWAASHWHNMTTPQQDPDAQADMAMSAMSRDWLSFLFMTLGWFLLLSSCVGFWRVKRWESSIRAPVPEPSTASDLERDQAIRVNISRVFGFDLHDDRNPPSQQALEAEARLQRDLQRAGLL